MKHFHYCVCGKSCECSNEACPNDDICPDCEREREDAREGEYWDAKIEEAGEA
jgi:hypothetical protein